MTDRATLALAMTLGDSAFPSGAFTASWGLEGLHADGLVHDAATLDAFVLGQLHHRWATFDRPLLQAAHRAANDDDAVVVDERCEALTVAPAARSASRRAGISTLTIHTQLGSVRAASYASLVRAGRAPGHLVVAQALVWAEAGIDLAAAEVMAGLQHARQLVSAAVRLGIVGHVDAQRTLAAAADHVIVIAATPCDGEPHSSTPLADIAMLRHPDRSTRLFAV